MEYINQFLSQYFTPDQLTNLSNFFIRTLIILAILYFIHFIVISRAKALAKKTVNDFDDLIADILISLGSPFYFFLSIYTSNLFYQLPYNINYYIEKVSFIIFVYYAIQALAAIINFGFKKALKMQTKEDRDPTLIAVLNRLASIILWIIGGVIILQNFDYNVTAIVGGLGITGIAVALAVQNILADIFSFISIYFDQPFKVGDFITIGDDSGTVERIGLKSTRIRTLRGEELVISNRELSDSRINNFRKLDNRGLELNISVEYETPQKKLEQIPQFIEDIITANKDLIFAWARLKEFSDSGLEYNIYCYVKSADYAVYLKKRQDLILAIYQKLRQEKINLNYQTETIYIKK